MLRLLKNFDLEDTEAVASKKNDLLRCGAHLRGVPETLVKLKQELGRFRKRIETAKLSMQNHRKPTSENGRSVFSSFCASFADADFP
jgi:hypothetical protein